MHHSTALTGAQARPSKKEILSHPTRPVTVDEDKTVAGLLEKMRGSSFQGRNLADAFQIWKSMLQDECTIMMGMSGAMIRPGCAVWWSG